MPRLKTLYQNSRPFLGFLLGLSMFVVLNIAGFWIIYYTTGHASLLPVGKTLAGLTWFDCFNPVLTVVSLMAICAFTLALIILYALGSALMAIGEFTLSLFEPAEPSPVIAKPDEIAASIGEQP